MLDAKQYESTTMRAVCGVARQFARTERTKGHENVQYSYCNNIVLCPQAAAAERHWWPFVCER